MARLTQELFAIPMDGDSFLIYAPLQKSAFVGSREWLRLLARIRNGKEYDSDSPMAVLLRELGILDPVVDAIPEKKASGDPEPTTVSLFLTTACNLRCTYCYASAGDRPERNMQLETAKSGIDFVVANGLRQQSGHFSVSYHGGGEPTVNWTTLTESWSYARKRAMETGLRCSATLATNGVVSDAHLDWIVANIQAVMVSFDGLPELTDQNRPTILGQGVSQRVLHTIARLDENRLNYSIRATILPDQVRRLPEAVDFLFSRFRPRLFQIEPIFPSGRGAAMESCSTAEFLAAFREARRRAATYNQDINFSAVKVGSVSGHFCGVTNDSFCLSADGNVSSCYEVFSEDDKHANVFFYGKQGNAPGAYVFDHMILNNLRNATVNHKSHCRDCFAKWTCSGDCHHKTLESSGDNGFAGSPRCEVIRELTKDLILERIEQTGGTFWRDPTCYLTGGQPKPVCASPREDRHGSREAC